VVLSVALYLEVLLQAAMLQAALRQVWRVLL